MSKLTVLQERAVSLLAEGATQAATARACGVTKQTMGHWVKKPEFRTRLEQLSKSVENEVKVELNYALPAAIRFIGDVAAGRIDDDPKILGARLRAATFIVDRFDKKKMPGFEAEIPSEILAKAELVSLEDAEDLINR